MTKEQYDKYSSLLDREEEVKIQLNFLKKRVNSGILIDVPISELGWLSLSWGNGSDNSTVLDKREDVMKVCALIKELLVIELQKIEKEKEAI